MPAAQIANRAEPGFRQARQILIRQPVQRIGPEQHPMAQRPPLMALPTAQVTQIGRTFKGDEPGKLLRLPIHRASLRKLLPKLAASGPIFHHSLKLHKNQRFALADFCAFCMISLIGSKKTLFFGGAQIRASI